MSDGVLVATDLDGSLWGHDLRCHPETLGAVAELERRGIPLLVATGRRAQSARAGLRANGLNPPSVLLNGAIGIDFETGDVFHRRTLGPAAAGALVDGLADAGAAPVMYLLDGSTTGPADVTTGADHRASMGDDFTVADPQRVAADQDVLSMAMIGLPRERLEAVVPAVPEDAADVILYADHLYSALAGAERWSIHIQPKGISKRDGIEAFVAYAGLAPERIIAIGDGTNDLEMLGHADVALGVAGGHAEALAVADEVIDPPDRGGWRRVLDFL